MAKITCSPDVSRPSRQQHPSSDPDSLDEHRSLAIGVQLPKLINLDVVMNSLVFRVHPPSCPLYRMATRDDKCSPYPLRHAAYLVPDTSLVVSLA